MSIRKFQLDEHGEAAVAEIVEEKHVWYNEDAIIVYTGEDLPAKSEVAEDFKEVPVLDEPKQGSIKTLEDVIAQVEKLTATVAAMQKR